MASVHQIPRESFRALAERTRYEKKKIIIVEGKDDCNVFHYHSTNDEKLLIICKEIKTIDMPNPGTGGNVATIIANATCIQEEEHISAIIDSDINVYMNHHEFSRTNQESSIYASSGYSIENYALSRPEEIHEHFRDLFVVGTNIEKWDESITISIKCFYILSLLYFTASERGEVRYHEVRTLGGNFFNEITTNNISSDNYLEVLKNYLTVQSISIDTFEDLNNSEFFDTMKIDGKLISKCIRLALYSCNCRINDLRNNEMDRRLVCMIGERKYSSHLSNAINSLAGNNS